MNALPLPSAASGDKRRLLMRRFENCLAQHKPVIVSHLDMMNTKLQTTTGLPSKALDAVLHVKVTPRQLAIIPIAQVVDIRLLYPEEPRR
jgi:hypothetical protein